MVSKDGVVINDGMEIISYLDKVLQENSAAKKTTTGIILGSRARVKLTQACKHVMGESNLNDEVTINRFKNVLIVEDGNDIDRIEVISGGVAPIMESQSPFKGLGR
jgi:hypothetical protein